MTHCEPDHINSPDEASGYLTEPLVKCTSHFTEITELHRSGRNIVLKAKRYGRWWVLKSAIADENVLVNQAALSKEFEISLQLPLDGTTHVYSLEDVEGYGPCIVMDYIEGPTLRAWLDSDPDGDAREAIARQLVDTVGRVHRLGIVHRDIKPENIIVTAIGNRPVLIDFGLADTLVHTELKNPAGTHRYMSPEQFTANVPDVRNDIYSLGCVLKEMGLPLCWRVPVARCLRPIASRVADVDALERLLRRSRRTLRVIAGAAVVAVLAAAVAVWRPSTPAGGMHAGADETLRRTADSLRESIDSIEAGSAREIAMLQGRLDDVNDSIARARRDTEARAAAVEEAIKAESAEIDRIWRMTGMRYLDTVDASGFVANIYSTEPMDREVRRFMKQADGRFSADEKIKISDALNERVKTNLELWIERRQKMPSNY